MTLLKVTLSVTCLVMLLLCPTTSARRITTTPDNDSPTTTDLVTGNPDDSPTTTDLNTEFATELGPLDSSGTRSPSPRDSPPTDSTTPRSQNPVFNVWEFARISGGHFQNQRTTTPASAQPQSAQLNTVPRNTESPCKFAIISCCEDNLYRDSCFDTYGCSGAWFDNLCSHYDAVRSSFFNDFLDSFDFARKK